MIQELDRKYGFRKKYLAPLLPDVDPALATLLGFALGISAAGLIFARQVLAGAILFLLSSIVDSLDGEIARKYKRVSKKGSFLDDLSDRIVDVSVFLAIGSLASSPFLGALAGVVLVFNSYLSLYGLVLGGEKARFGIFSRANRNALVFLVLLASAILNVNLSEPLLIGTLIFGTVTAGERTLLLLVSRKEGGKEGG